MVGSQHSSEMGNTKSTFKTPVSEITVHNLEQYFFITQLKEKMTEEVGLFDAKESEMALQRRNKFVDRQRKKNSKTLFSKKRYFTEKNLNSNGRNTETIIPDSVTILRMEESYKPHFFIMHLCLIDGRSKPIRNSSD